VLRTALVEVASGIAAPWVRERSLGVTEPSGGVLGVVGDDDVGAARRMGGERLEDGCALVEIAGGAGRLHIAYSPLT